MHRTQRCGIRTSTVLFRESIHSSRKAYPSRNGVLDENKPKTSFRSPRTASIRNTGRPPIILGSPRIRSEENKLLAKEIRQREQIVDALATRSGGTLYHGTTLDPALASQAMPTRTLNEVRPGDFIEEHGDSGVRCGVVLPMSEDTQTSRVSSNYFCLALVTGEISLLRFTGVQLTIPAFVDESLAFQARRVPVSAEESMQDPHSLVTTHTKDEVVLERFDAPRFQARATICAALRALIQQSEVRMRQLWPTFQEKYHSSHETSTSDDDEKRPRFKSASSVALTLLRLQGVPEQEAIVEANLPATMYAVHRLMVSSPKLFRLDDVSHRNTQLFSVLPSADRRMLTEVEMMVKVSLARGSASKAGGRRGRSMDGEKSIEGFSRRARAKIEERAKAINGMMIRHRDEAPKAIEHTPSTPIAWTQDDQTLLRFLRFTLGQRRHMITEASSELAMHILNECDYNVESAADSFDAPKAAVFYPYENQTALIARFLTDLGLLTPWDDAGTMQNEFCDVIEPPNVPSKEVQLEDKDERIRKDVYETVYVIDDESAAELDDGLSIRQTDEPDQSWVEVHIADPAAGVRIDDDVARDARERHASVYLPEDRHPMLPASIVDCFGLRPTNSADEQPKDMRALTFSAKVNHSTGAVTDVNLQLSRLHRTRVISYAQAGQTIAGRRTDDAQTIEDLKRLDIVCQALRRRRQTLEGAVLNYRNNGEMEKSISPLPLPRSPIRQNHCPDDSPLFIGYPTIQFRVKSNADLCVYEANARNIISEMAILAGRAAARWAEERKVPLLYRAMLAPTQEGVYERFVALRNEQGELDLSAAFRQGLSFSPGTLSHEPLEHFLLGARSRISMETKRSGRLSNDLLLDAGYARVTSPLRRYTDLLMHWQLRRALHNERSPLTKEDMRTLAPQLTRKDQWHASIERYSQRFWLMKWLFNAWSARTQIQHRGSDKGGLVRASSYLPGAYDEEALHFLDSVHVATVDDEALRSVGAAQTVRMSLLGVRLNVLCRWDRVKMGTPKLGHEHRVRITDIREAISSTSISVELVHS